MTCNSSVKKFHKYMQAKMGWFYVYDSRWYETGAYLSEAGLQCLPIHPDESVVPHVEMR